MDGYSFVLHWICRIKTETDYVRSCELIDQYFEQHEITYCELLRLYKVAEYMRNKI